MNTLSMDPLLARHVLSTMENVNTQCIQVPELEDR